jgi:quinol monooxygenase YgiN
VAPPRRVRDRTATRGCELYLINRQTRGADAIWVTEAWRGQADLDASLETIHGREEVAATMSLVDDSEMIELAPLCARAPGSLVGDPIVTA